MKRYIKSSTEIDMKLPRLEKAIKDYQNNNDMLAHSDFKYRVEDDGVEGSVLIYVFDINEYIGTYEFYEFIWVDKMIKRFETAIQRDTGDKNFYLDAYNSVEFCGRAWID